MAKAGIRAGLLASCLILGSGWATAWAAPPTVQQVLAIHPHQDGVLYTTPTAQEEAGCKVELVKGQGKGSGWVLKDSHGQLLRRFFDSNDDNRIDVWSYYKDGVEVYREIASKFTKDPDQFRWLNGGGSKWGVDENGDGKIDSWKIISPEEVSQEIVQALLKQDLHRLQALMLTDAELKALGLPAADEERIRTLRNGAAAKFQKTVAALAHFSTDKTHWLHLETQQPMCLPNDTSGKDVLLYQGGTILCETASKNDWLQTGTLIQVGLTWRIIDAPSVGLANEDSLDNSGGKLVTDQELQKLLDQLRDLDAKSPKNVDATGANPEVVQYNLQRADLLEKIVAKVKAEEREPWVRQVADSLSAAVQASPAADKAAATRLTKLVTQTTEAAPGSALAAYVTYREMSADYAVKLMTSNASELNKAQEAWLERLAQFVQTYPKADDAADALLQLGMVSEFLGKEIEAKKWYGQLAKDHADKPQGPKGTGALRRLELEGKPIKLAGPLLSNPNSAYDLDQVHGKITVIYYWASWNGQSAGDFIKLKALLDTYGPKGVELVCVNLDSTVEEAKAFIQRTSAPGTHLYQPGGLECKLATDYGVMVLPNLFLVGKDGKVLSRTVQMSNLEEEVKKALK
jgi:hypothetical protein